jgi:hypothetical protein
MPLLTLDPFKAMIRATLATAASRLGWQRERMIVISVANIRTDTCIHEIQARFLATRIDGRREKREAEVAAKRARRKAAKEKEAEMWAHQEATAQIVLKRQEAELRESQDIVQTPEEKQEKQRIHVRDQKRHSLLLEAGAMSRSLYRTCLRCVKIMRQGNEHDEAEFRQREENQFVSMKDALATGTLPVGPVDRENELSSRAIYYLGHTRENFIGEHDCLKWNPWKEEHVDRYLHFLRQGEYKRKWVMNDYKFPDPYANVFDNDRVDRWEAQARELLKDTYDAHGWILPSSESELHSRESEKTTCDDDDDYF